MKTPDLTIELRERITGEIFFALGMRRDGLARRLSGFLFRKPTAHFARIFAMLEDEVPRSGLPGGARRIAPEFNVHPAVSGAQNMPASGPLLVVSNHPGAYDSIAIVSHIPRPDLKIAVSDVPFLRAFPHTGGQFIYVPVDPNGRMTALRQCITHLKDGGALFMFAHGEVEPDPALGDVAGAYAAIADWSPSIEAMLRKVPATCCVPVIASGVLLKRFVDNPITRLRRQPFHRQKLGEVLQVLQQMVSPASVKADVRLSFGSPLYARDLAPEAIMPTVIQAARNLLAEHARAYNIPSS